MTVTFRPAKREQVGLLVGLAGASGSGKSYSALRLATGLAGGKPFAFIDTEAGRALHYADQFEFHHAELHPPFRPERYMEAIRAADEAGYPVIVVDSASHEHAGEGGLLDWHDELMGGDEKKKMSAWIEPKMSHKRFVSRLLQLRAHLILCFRAEEKIEIGRENGRTVVRPMRSLTGLDGWVPICEKSLPYELTISLLLTPDAPGVPKPIKLQQQHRPFLPLDQPIGEDSGRALAEWAAGSGGSVDGGAAAEVQDLIARLLELADVLGARDATMAAVAKNRRAHAGDLGAHAEWLRAQVGKAEAKAAVARDSADEDLFAELPEETPA